MKVLHRLTAILRILGVYNSENFRGNRRRILRHFFRVCDVTISLVLFVMTTLMIMWYSKDENYRMSSQAIPSAVNGCQVIIACVTLIVKNRTISEAINHLRSTIGKSEYFYGISMN